jgi:hypothetical protein
MQVGLRYAEERAVDVLSRLRVLHGSRLKAFLLTRHLKSLIRACALAAFGLTGPIVSQAKNMAAKAYNDACFNDAPVIPVHDTNDWLSFLGMGLMVLLPVVCARTRPVAGTNLLLSIGTLLLACRLLATAGTPPYECYSHGGVYEDRVSGLVEFEMWFFLTLLILYLTFFVHGLIWVIRQVCSRPV